MEVNYLTHSSELLEVEPHVMAIGFFDGVHLGHQTLFKHVNDLSGKLGIKSSALTFSPHPDEVIKRMFHKKYITPLQEKIDKISQCGIDRLYVMKFDKHFASLSPNHFIQKYLTGMNVKHVVVGFDFTFGYRAEGDTHLLEKESLKGNFGLTVIPKKTYSNTKISSTATRELLDEGNVEAIPQFLGENYRVKALILPYYTNNNTYLVKLTDRYMLPRPGKYEVSVLNHQIFYEGILIISSEYDIQLFINDFNDINGELTIEFLNRMRVEQAILV